MEVGGQLEDPRTLTTKKVRTSLQETVWAPELIYCALNNKEDYFRYRESNHYYTIVQLAA